MNTNQRIDQHEIYQKLINEYPWLWEAPSHSISDEDYKKAFKLGHGDWFPYVNYYNLNVLEELKPYLFSFSGLLANGQALVLRAVWQVSQNTVVSSIFSKHPHSMEEVVLYLDFLTVNNKEMLDWYKKLESYQFKKAVPFGFHPASPQ